MGLKHVALACLVVSLGIGCGKGDSKDKGTSKTKPGPGKTKPDPTPKPQTGTKPMIQQLIAAAKGKQAAFYAGKKGVGLFIVGAEAKKLSEHAAGMGAYTAPAGVLWYVAETKLWALDLRKPAPKPVAVVEGVPENIKIVITVGEGKARVRTVLGEPMVGEYLALTWGPAPALAAKAEVEERADKDLLAKANKAKLVGADWLKAKRTILPMLKRPWKTSKIAGMDTGCSDEDACYQATQFGNSGWQLVVAQYSCGDGCHSECVLYDPKTKKVAQPGTAPKPKWTKVDELDSKGKCDGYTFDSFGKSYIMRGDDKLCVLGGTCEGLPGVAIGLLYPGAAISM